MELKSKKLLKTAVFFLCVLAPLAAWLGFGKQGLIHLYRTDRERQLHVDRIMKLTQENQALLEEINRLGNDMDYLASVARKELNLIKKNEIIYRFNTEEGGRMKEEAAGGPEN